MPLPSASADAVATAQIITLLLCVGTLQRCRNRPPQVEREFNRIAPELSSLAVYGGTAQGPQIGEMRRGVDIIVGTPGRIIDHIEQGNLNLVREDYSCLCRMFSVELVCWIKGANRGGSVRDGVCVPSDFSTSAK